MCYQRFCVPPNCHFLNYLHVHVQNTYRKFTATDGCEHGWYVKLYWGICTCVLLLGIVLSRLCSWTIVCAHSAGSLISLCSVNSIQTCNVALCKPRKCQGMSFMFQPLSFHVSAVSGLVSSTSTTHVNFI